MKQSKTEIAMSMLKSVEQPDSFRLAHHRYTRLLQFFLRVIERGPGGNIAMAMTFSMAASAYHPNFNSRMARTGRRAFYNLLQDPWILSVDKTNMNKLKACFLDFEEL